jgi:pimeloyl-ACP methyl ester carboxylesterase
MAAATRMMFDEFERIGVPVLLLVGRHSSVFGSKAAGRVARQFSDARVAVFRNSAHAVQLEEPALFAEVVTLFVKETAPP